MELEVVWYRLRVSESQQHTPTQTFSEYPTPSRALFWKSGYGLGIRNLMHAGQEIGGSSTEFNHLPTGA